MPLVLDNVAGGLLVSRMQFSLASILLGVVLVAFGLTALRTGSILLGSLAFSVNLATLCFSLVATRCTTGVKRAFWLGFAFFGWPYFFVAHVQLIVPVIWSSSYYWDAPREWPPPPLRDWLITTKAIDALRERLEFPARVGQHVQAQFRDGGSYPGRVTEIKDGQYHLVFDDGDETWGPADIIIGSSRTDYQSIGHAVLNPIVAWFGGMLAAWFLGSATPQKPKPNGAEGERQSSGLAD